jgi:hypothetical protein
MPLTMRRRTCGASGEARGGGGLGEETMAVNGRHLFAKVEKQVSELKERIARQREVIKRAKQKGHPTAAAETIQHTLHQSLAPSRNAASKSLRGWKRSGRPKGIEGKAQFEISVDGKPRSYRDRRAVALEAAEHLKRRHPNSEVTVRDLASGEATAVTYKAEEPAR